MDKKKHKALSKELIRLNDLYHKYLYITSVDSIDKEKQRLLKEFGVV